MGLKLSKIHRGVSFNEEAWLKPYIELNTQLRTKPTNDFEKDFFKLMNNSVSGKTMENIRNRVIVRLRTREKSAEKLVPKPNYERTTIFSKSHRRSYEKNGTCFQQASLSWNVDSRNLKDSHE